MDRKITRSEILCGKFEFTTSVTVSPTAYFRPVSDSVYLARTKQFVYQCKFPPYFPA